MVELLSWSLVLWGVVLASAILLTLFVLDLVKKNGLSPFSSPPVETSKTIDESSLRGAAEMSATAAQDRSTKAFLEYVRKESPALVFLAKSDEQAKLMKEVEELLLKIFGRRARILNGRTDPGMLTNEVPVYLGMHNSLTELTNQLLYSMWPEWNVTVSDLILEGFSVEAIPGVPAIGFRRVR